jgi:5-(carboxyamino)imidazole ribonucleotide mutase
MTWVAILMGSEGDWPVMQEAADTLEALGVGCEVRITSAHRTPRATAEYVAGAVAMPSFAAQGCLRISRGRLRR